MNGPKVRFSARSLLRWGLLLICCGAGIAVVAVSAAAADDEVATGGGAPFSIPAQPLADALNAYGEATRIPMFVDTELTAGRRSSAVTGVLSPFDALNGLLAGTGLAARSVGNSGFTLVPLRTAAVASPAASPRGAAAVARFDRYGAAIQRALHERLCRHQETRPGTFRVLVRLWIGGTGRIGRSEMLTSTGDGRRDRMLAAALQDFAIDEPPPPDLPQPVTLLLIPGAANAADYCQLSSVEQPRAEIQ